MALKLKNYYVEKGYPLKLLKSDNKIIGFPSGKKKKEGDPPILSEHIHADPIVKEWFKDLKARWATDGKKIEARVLNPHHFSKLLKTTKQASKDPGLKVELHDTDELIFFKYLGYDCVDQFREKMLLITTYTGFYYSSTYRHISKFYFSIVTLREDRAKDGLSLCLANACEFHDKDPGSVLEGDLMPFSESWKTYLRNTEAYLDVSIYTRVPIKKIYELLGYKQLYATLTSLSFRKELLNMECILVKETEAEADKQELIIKRYLNIRRNHFEVRILERDMHSMESLRVQHFPLDGIRHYAKKTYRTLSFGPQDHVIQSVFTINEDYSASLWIPHPEFEQPLVCRLALDNINDGSLLVWSYLPTNGIYSVTAINHVSFIGPKEVIKGSYCIINAKYKPNQTSTQFVMGVDDAKPVPVRYTMEEAKHATTTSEIMDRLLKNLLS